MRGQHYIAVYIGNGKVYNLFCVFVPGASGSIIDALVIKLREHSYAILVADVDTAWPVTVLSFAPNPE